MLSDFRARGMLAVIASPVFARRQNPLDCPSITARIPALARAVSQASTHCRGHVQKSGARCPLSAQWRRLRQWSATSASLKGFGRRPFAGALGLGAGPASESLVRRKPREGRGAVWLGGSYGNFGVADGSPMWRRGWRAAGVIVRSEHDALFRGRGCERRVWAQRLERVCGGREDIAFLLRRARGGEGDKHSEAGSGTMIMRCRS